MSSICTKFKKSLVYNSDRAITVEDTYRMTAAYAGIHELDIKSENIANWFDELLWQSFDSNIWSVNSTGITGSNGPGYIFSNNIVVDPIKTPYSFVIELTTEGSGGFCFRVTDNSTYYIFKWDTNDVSFEKIVDNNVEILSKMPIGISNTKHKIKIMCREYQYTGVDNDVWLLMSAWVDDHHIIASADNIGQGLYPKDGIGFYVGSGSSVSWTQVYSPVLSIPVEWSIIDPNQSASSAANESVGDRRIKLFMRYDGSMRIWRPSKAKSQWAISRNRFEVTEIEDDPKKIITHMRLWGAYHRAEYMDSKGVNLYGRKFSEENDPNMYVYRELFEEAIFRVLVSQSESLRISFSIPYQPYLEPEDVITTPDSKHWIVDSFDLQITDKKIQQNINARRYVWG